MKIDEIRKKAAGATVVTLGELMLRLSPPGNERFLQSPLFEARFGGGEANVAVSLALSGVSARFVTALPAARSAARRGASRGFGVGHGRIAMIKDSRSHLLRREGASQRARRHLRRESSAINSHASRAVDWTRLPDCGWFHITGITPDLSQSAADLGLPHGRGERRGA